METKEEAVRRLFAAYPATRFENFELSIRAYLYAVDKYEEKTITDAVNAILDSGNCGGLRYAWADLPSAISFSKAAYFFKRKTKK